MGENSKKIVLKLHLHDDKAKQKALHAVSSLVGIESVGVDMKEKKLTVIGDVDTVDVVAKLRKKCLCTEILTVGPAKEPEKKKEEPKKEEPKKDDKKKEEDKICHVYNPCLTRYCHVVSVEENPNACIIL